MYGPAGAEENLSAEAEIVWRQARDRITNYSDGVECPKPCQNSHQGNSCLSHI